MQNETPAETLKAFRIHSDDVNAVWSKAGEIWGTYCTSDNPPQRVVMRFKNLCEIIGLTPAEFIEQY